MGVKISRSRTPITIATGAAQALLSIPSSAFTIDANYLILASTQNTGSTNAARLDTWLAHGSTDFPGTLEEQELPEAAGSMWTYSSFAKWTAVSGEAIELWGDCLTASTTCTFDEMVLMVIPLDGLIQNTDWFYDSNSQLGANLSNTFSANKFSRITFTPDGTSDYLVFGTSQIIIDAVTDDILGMELHNGTSQLALAQRDGEDTADLSVLSLISILNSPSASSTTYSLQFTGNSIHDHNMSQLFILRLNAFAVYDTNSVDQNFLITPVHTVNSSVSLSLPSDGNALVFFGTAAKHELGNIGAARWEFRNRVDSNVLSSADANQFRSWSDVTQTLGSDLDFQISFDDVSLNTSPHTFDLSLIQRGNPDANAHSNRRSAVAAFSTRFAGVLDVNINHPSIDGNTYTAGVNFPVSARIGCSRNDCGLVDANLQYCVGQGCANFYDINSVSGSPLQLMVGSNPDSNSDLNVSQTYDANWTIKANAAGTYELRVGAVGAAAYLVTTSGTNRTITVSAGVDYSFVLSLPSSGCTNGKGNITGGTSCQRGWIETTDITGTADENQLAPEGQSSSQPFFVYDNQSSSSSDLNIILDLNAALAAPYVLKAAPTSSGYQGQCSGLPSGCITLSASTQNVGKAVYSAGSQDLNVWFWGDFVVAAVGRVDVNVDSNSIAST